MTTTFKRRIYRISLMSATCFLIGILLYDLGDANMIDMIQSYIFSYLLLFAGSILGFKALEVWSAWEEDTSEDKADIEYRRNAYPMTFYVEAGMMVLLVVFLLAVANVRNQPNIQEEMTAFFALLIAGGCVLIGHMSSYLE